MFLHPTVEILLTDLADEGGAIDFNIILSLLNIDPIKEGDEAKAFEWDGEAVVDQVKDLLRNGFGGGSNGKIIHLAEEEDAMSMYETRVEAGFVCSRREADQSENSIGMFFP